LVDDIVDMTQYVEHMTLRRNQHILAFSLIAAVSAISLSALVIAPPARGAIKATATKKTVPPKKKPKKTLPPKTVANAKKVAAQKAKAVDTSASRDASCNRLFKARADTLANAFSGTGTTDEIIKAGTAANAKMYQALSEEETLPILSWAYYSAAGSYVLLNVPLTAPDPKGKLDEVVARIADELEGFAILEAYAVTRCNFSMFLHDLDNLDAPPDPDSAAMWAAQIEVARENAKKLFPPMPPASATWPRKSLYI
jgi:hypothetical protein